LPTNGVRQVYLDREGYIWIATVDGLCRYDGYQIKIYKSNLWRLTIRQKINKRITGIKTYAVLCVEEENEHTVWLVTESGGAFKVLISDSIISFVYNPFPQAHLSTPMLFAQPLEKLTCLPRLYPATG
jgi:ligand-binding sensor domain-containing protein